MHVHDDTTHPFFHIQNVDDGGTVKQLIFAWRRRSNIKRTKIYARAIFEFFVRWPDKKLITTDIDLVKWAENIQVRIKRRLLDEILLRVVDIKPTGIANRKQCCKVKQCCEQS